MNRFSVCPQTPKSVFDKMKNGIPDKDVVVLKRFCEDLRTYQLERKFGETPDFHTPTEIEVLESEEKRREQMFNQKKSSIICRDL